MTKDYAAPDWRGLCEELVEAAEHHVSPYAGHHSAWEAAMDRARAALAHPEPEVVGPSDDDLALIYHDCCRGCEFMDQVGFEDGARAVLSRYDRPAPAPAGERQFAPVPVAVSERLPELRGMFERILCVARSSGQKPVGNIELADRLVKAVVSWSALPLPSVEVEA